MSRYEHISRKAAEILPGILMASVIAGGAWIIHASIIYNGENPVSPVIIAIVLGALAGNLLKRGEILSAGLNFAIGKILKTAIIILGLSFSLTAVVRTGTLSLAVIVITVTLAIALAYFMGVRLGLPHRLSALIAVGTAICGATAIVCTAPVIEAGDEEITYAVATITIFGMLAIFLYPLLGVLLLLSDLQYGIWAGVAIHETAQVIAAGFAFSPGAGEIATVVKLTRTALLAPLILIIGALYARKQNRPGGQKVYCLRAVPWFAAGFLLMAGLRTVGDIHWSGVDSWQALLSAAGILSKQLIVIAMAGVGLKTNFRSLKYIGGIRPMLVGLGASLIMAAVSFLIIAALGI
jgi:uncharacterized integral membrane protein (TIGR00698 family)